MATQTGFPDSTNTGPTGNLTVYNGDLVVNQNGAVISGLDIRGSVVINADNVTFINCKVTNDDFYSVAVYGDNVTIQNCYVDNQGAGGTAIAIRGSGDKVIANEIVNWENGIDVAGNNLLIQDNYIHDAKGPNSAHFDGIQADGDFSNLTIRHNTVINEIDQTSAIMIDNGWGPISNVVVDNNLLAGGGFTIYVDGQFKGGSITGVVITNNHMGKGDYGITNFNRTSPTYTGNTTDGWTLVSGLNQDHTDIPGPDTPSIASFSSDSGVQGDHITNDSTLTLTGTADANSTVRVYDGASLLGTVSANGSGAWNYTTAALGNGGHNLTATATDAAGNTSAASAALAVTIDTVAPSKPVIATDTINSNHTVALTGTAEANSTVSVYDGAKLLGTAHASGNGTWNYTTPALSNGGHNLTATATDAAGNTSAASAAMSVTVTVDTAAPGAPSIASFSSDSGVQGDHITNDSTLTLTGTAEANSTVKIYDGTKLLGTVSANGSGAWNYTTTALGNGGHNLTATTTDAAGNTSAASTALAVTIDTVAPTAPVIATDTVNGNDTIFLTGTAEANSTVNVYDGAKFLGTAHTNGNGTWSYTTPALSNGAHDLIATATDAAGNTSAASQVLDPVIGSVDPTAPSIASFSSDSGVQGDHITNDSTLTLTGMAEANSTVRVYDGASLLGTVSANGSGAWNYTTAALGNGGHNLTATATDAAGNTSAASAALAVTIDTVAPSKPVIATDTINSNHTVALTGTAEANSTVKIYDGTSLLGTTTTDGTGAWGYTTSALANGAHSITASDTDAAGNTSAQSAGHAVTIASPQFAGHFYGTHNSFTWGHARSSAGVVANSSVSTQVTSLDTSAIASSDTLQSTSNVYADLAKTMADASISSAVAVATGLHDHHHHTGNLHNVMMHQLTKHDFHSV